MVHALEITATKDNPIDSQFLAEIIRKPIVVGIEPYTAKGVFQRTLHGPFYVTFEKKDEAVKAQKSCTCGTWDTERQIMQAASIFIVSVAEEDMARSNDKDWESSQLKVNRSIIVDRGCG